MKTSQYLNFKLVCFAVFVKKILIGKVKTKIVLFTVIRPQLSLKPCDLKKNYPIFWKYLHSKTKTDKLASKVWKVQSFHKY